MPKRDEKRDAPAASPSRSGRTTTSARRSATTRSPICPGRPRAMGRARPRARTAVERDADGEGEGAIALLDPDEAAARLAAGAPRRPGDGARRGRPLPGRGAALPAAVRAGRARAGRRGARARRPERRAHAGRAQPAAGDLDRVPVPAGLGEHPRPVPGGERRVDGGGQALGADARAALRHLRRLLDPRLRAALPDDELAPHPRRQHARGAQAVLPPREGAAEAARRRHRRDAQAAGRQAGRRREATWTRCRAHLESREVSLDPRPGRRAAATRAIRCPSAWRAAAVARGRGGARRARRRRCTS